MSPEFKRVTTGQAEPTTTPPTGEEAAAHLNAKQERLQQWHGAIDMELKSCMNEAADLKKKINESKTQAKRSYYEKKFKKVTERTIQMLAALQNVKHMEADNESQPVV